MKPAMLVGVILIAAGVLILVLHGILFTRKDTASMDPVKLEQNYEETQPVVQIVGAVSLAGGLFLVVLGSRK